MTNNARHPERLAPDFFRYYSEYLRGAPPGTGFVATPANNQLAHEASRETIAHPERAETQNKKFGHAGRGQENLVLAYAATSGVVTLAMLSRTY